MRVIGVDPGYDRLGVAVVERTTDGKETVVFSCCVTTDKQADLPERLHQLGREFVTILNTYTPQAFAIETLFFNQNQKTALGVAAARGVLLYAAKEANCSIHEYSPQEVKVAITGYGKSDKAAVTTMVTRLIANAPAKALDDEYDAIAVAVTHLATRQQSR